MLYEILVTNQGWHTIDVEVCAGIYAIGGANDYESGHDLVGQKVAHHWTNIGLLTK